MNEAGVQRSKRVRANAKINLGLKVLRRRRDGYHEILSVLQEVDLCDWLTFTPAGAGVTEVSCDDPSIPSGQGNLVFRSVEALRECTGIDRGVSIHIEKRIPVGAGLGGGSSDAAGVLRELNGRWDLGLSPDGLRDIAARIGSDVPFFLQGGTAIASGRGEKLQDIEWGWKPHYLLVCPGTRISTSWAYANLRIGLTERSEYVNFLRSTPNPGSRPRELVRHIENDFLPLLEETLASVRSVVEAVRGTRALACSLSGSGSTVYGIFDDCSDAESAATRLGRDGLQVFLCRPAAP